MTDDYKGEGGSKKTQEIDQPGYDPQDRTPVEVFRAVEGEWKQLAEYLRSGQPKSYYTLEAIAAWMAGELPPHRPPGNPGGTPMDRRRRAVSLALGEHLYRQRFESAGRPKGGAKVIADGVAEELGLDLVKFANYVRRSSTQKKHKLPPKMTLVEEMWWEWKEQQ